MAMQFKKEHLIAILIGLTVVIGDILFLKKTPLFLPVIGIGLIIVFSEFLSDYYSAMQRQKDIESRFPEFVRNLSGIIKSGMPVSRAIIQVSNTDYGHLTPYVKKLANQIEWAIPVHRALLNFSNASDSPVIKRAISTVIEAEMSGGNIEDVLQTVTESVIKIKSIKEKRKAAIHSQIVQSYIIFIIFLGVMVVIQNLLIPYIIGMGRSTTGNLDNPLVSGATNSQAIEKLTQEVKISYSSPAVFIRTSVRWFSSLQGIFLMLALIQAFFAGLVLGKMAEGDMRSGLKHSLILITIAFLVITFGQGFF